jgi:hypothetical protein
MLRTAVSLHVPIVKDALPSLARGLVRLLPDRSRRPTMSGIGGLAMRKIAQPSALSLSRAGRGHGLAGDQHRRVGGASHAEQDAAEQHA